MGGFPSGRGRLRAGGPEDGDFFDTPVGRKDFVGISDFAHDPLKLLEIPQVGSVGCEAQDS